MGVFTATGDRWKDGHHNHVVNSRYGCSEPRVKEST